MVVSPAMRPLLLLVLKLGKPLLLISAVYLVTATSAMLIAIAKPDAVGPAGQSLVHSMDEYGWWFAGVIGIFGLEVWGCSWLLRAIPPEATD